MRNKHARRPLLALTVGEPAGIGPDLCVLLAHAQLPADIVAVGDRRLLEERARLLGRTLSIVDFTPGSPPTTQPGTLAVLHEPLPAPVMPGAPDPRNAKAVLSWLRTAAQGCLAGTFDAMVTAPMHKGVINDAGIPFTGHTEYLAELTQTPKVVMLLAGGGMRVALATTHLPLSAVPAAITRDDLEATLRVLTRGLTQRFGIVRPRIVVAGLNPHAGEGGHLGREEIEVIVPVLDRLRAEGMDLIGPLPADTLFNPQALQEMDCVLAMYHDQGLPVLKYAAFGTAVNVTLGLPIIRTSVDHGTALDRAATGDIEIGSMLAAVEMAAQLVNRRLPSARTMTAVSGS